jgi:hypothetical protein
MAPKLIAPKWETFMLDHSRIHLAGIGRQKLGTIAGVLGRS